MYWGPVSQQSHRELNDVLNSYIVQSIKSLTFTLMRNCIQIKCARNELCLPSISCKICTQLRYIPCFACCKVIYIFKNRKNSNPSKCLCIWSYLVIITNRRKHKLQNQIWWLKKRRKTNSVHYLFIAITISSKNFHETTIHKFK